MTLLEEFDVNVIWQWHNNAHSVGSALSAAGKGDYGNALQYLKSGQGHNPHVQDVYQQANDIYGAAVIFARVAVTTDRSPDFALFKTNTDWQYQNNLDSLTSAYRDWQGGNDLLGFADLVGGQLHNPDVCVLYTACWGNNPGQVKTIINGYFAR